MKPLIIALILAGLFPVSTLAQTSIPGRVTSQVSSTPPCRAGMLDLRAALGLLPGESFTFEVYFQPSKAGVFSANLEILSEAESVNITFSGRAYSEAEITQQQDRTGLLTIYPNPFSQSTQISFTSQDAGYADISIVNLLGSEVARIFSGELDAGEHSFSWDAGGAAAGMYECVVRAGGEVQRIALSCGPK
jgi:hypothetical protein